MDRFTEHFKESLIDAPTTMGSGASATSPPALHAAAAAGDAEQVQATS